MTTIAQNIITDLENSLRKGIISGDDSDGDDPNLHYKLQLLYSQLLENYQEQRELTPILVNLYEKYKERSFAYLIWFIQVTVDSLINMTDLDSPEQQTWQLPDAIDDVELLRRAMEGSFIKNSATRLSDDLPMALSEDDMQGLFGVAARIIENAAIKGQLEDDDIQTQMMLLCLMRPISQRINKAPAFYTICTSLLDNLHHNEQFQLGRDICEELLICGFKDNAASYAFYAACRFNARTHNFLLSLHYGLCLLMSLARSGNPDPGLVRRFFMIYPILLRNMHAPPLAIEFIENYGNKLKLKRSDQIKLDHTYFTCKAYTLASDVPQELASYIDRWREDIISGGQSEIGPWLSVLAAVVKKFPNETIGYDNCLTYYEYLKPFVTTKALDKQSVIFSDNVSQLVDALKNSAEQLSHTREETDFTYDNHQITLIASQLILSAHAHKNIDAYLLALAVSSDHMPLFESIAFDGNQLIKLNDNEGRSKNPYSERLFGRDRAKFLARERPLQFVFLGVGDTEVRTLVYDGKFRFLLESPQVADAIHWADERLAKLYYYDKVSGRNGQQYPKEDSDYQSEKTAILTELAKFTLNLHSQKPTIVIKDHQISTLPHHLLPHNSSELLIDLGPSICPISLDYLIEKANSTKTNCTLNTISCWIPIETLDYALNNLHSDLEDTIKTFNINLNSETVPKQPLTSDLNIICAHGSSGISGYPAFYAENEQESIAYTRLNRIIGRGKVLVLFVCHSGSMKSDFLSNQVMSLVKSYLSFEYEVVIAPFWALHIGIPPLWLPIFLQELQKEQTIVGAAWAANMAVKKAMPTPHAYACLHVYGNPYFRFTT